MPPKVSSIEKQIRKIYVSYIRPLIARDISRQRLKLVWDIWGYASLLTMQNLSLFDRLRLIKQFVAVDWKVLHAHKPKEIAIVCHALASRCAGEGEVMLEAGCWQGGSSAKFSLICKMLGYRLCIYDSFEGVEEMTPEEKARGTDFSGTYAAAESVVRENIMRYGDVTICHLHKGWFADTLAKGMLPYSVQVAYIDCDLAKGTKEVLTGVVPTLLKNGVIFSQDFHLGTVREIIFDKTTWLPFGRGIPDVRQLYRNLASIRFND